MVHYNQQNSLTTRTRDKPGQLRSRHAQSKQILRLVDNIDKLYEIFNCCNNEALIKTHFFVQNKSIVVEVCESIRITSRESQIQTNSCWSRFRFLVFLGRTNRLQWHSLPFWHCSGTSYAFIPRLWNFIIDMFESETTRRHLLLKCLDFKDAQEQCALEKTSEHRDLHYSQLQSWIRWHLKTAIVIVLWCQDFLWGKKILIASQNSDKVDIFKYELYWVSVWITGYTPFQALSGFIHPSYF